MSRDLEPKNLIHIVPSNKWGVVQQYAFEICRHYKYAGWKVSTMTRNALIIDSQFTAAEIPLIYGPLGGFFDLDSIRILAKKLQNSSSGKTIIHVHRFRDAFKAIIAKKLAKRNDIKIIATRHKVREGKDTMFYRWLYRNIDTLIFVSSVAYDRFRKSWGKRLPVFSDKICILRYSLDERNEWENNEKTAGPFTFLYQGEIAPGNGLETIIEALGSLPKRKFRIRIIGRGNPDYLDRLRNKAMKLGVINSIDWGKRDLLSAENARQAHCGIVISTGGISSDMSSLMFMAAGKPQITTSDGARAEYLKDGDTAVIVPAGDAILLGKRMMGLSEKPDLCSEIGTRAKELYDRLLSWQHFIKVLDSIYDI